MKANGFLIAILTVGEFILNPLAFSLNLNFNYI